LEGKIQEYNISKNKKNIANNYKNIAIHKNSIDVITNIEDGINTAFIMFACLYVGTENILNKKWKNQTNTE